MVILDTRVLVGLVHWSSAQSLNLIFLLKLLLSNLPFASVHTHHGHIRHLVLVGLIHWSSAQSLNLIFSLKLLFPDLQFASVHNNHGHIRHLVLTDLIQGLAPNLST